jgi:Ca2+-binding EF-hand superfamily protein
LREIFELFDDEGNGKLAGMWLYQMHYLAVSSLLMFLLGEINISQLRLKKGTFKDEGKRTMRFPEFIEVMRRKMSERDTHDEMLKAYK